MASRPILSHKQTKYWCTRVSKCVAVARGRLAAGAPLLLSLLHRHRKKKNQFLLSKFVSAVIACLFLLRKFIDESFANDNVTFYDGKANK